MCPLRRPLAPRFNPAEKVPMKSLVDRLEKKKKKKLITVTFTPRCPCVHWGTSARGATTWSSDLLRLLDPIAQVARGSIPVSLQTEAAGEENVTEAEKVRLRPRALFFTPLFWGTCTLARGQGPKVFMAHLLPNTSVPKCHLCFLFSVALHSHTPPPEGDKIPKSAVM